MPGLNKRAKRHLDVRTRVEAGLEEFPKDISPKFRVSKSKRKKNVRANLSRMRDRQSGGR